MRKFLCAVFAAALAGLLCRPASSFDLQNWYRKINAPRGRNIRRSQTAVAAVRGVDEPSQIDPDARDFDAVAAMEKESEEPSQVVQFAQDGGLKVPEAKTAAPADAGQDALVKAGSDALLNGVPLSAQMKSAVRPISLEEEMQIGRDVAANVAAQFGLFSDPALTGYVCRVGWTVARFSPRRDVPYRFAILNTDTLNAFAAPGGYIFITKGLLMSLRNEAELAAVLGHEIAHVTQKHVVKEIQKSKLASAAIPDYVSAEAQKAAWMKQISDLAVQSLWKGLSRQDELEADRLGMGYAAAAGYDARCFKDVLEMLKAKAQAPAGAKELKLLFSTHPAPEDRLKSAEEDLKAIPASGEKVPERFHKNVQI